MSVVTLEELKGKFETLDIPDGNDFVDLIETLSYIFGLSAVRVGPNETYTNLETALTENALAKAFILIGDVDDQGSIFDFTGRSVTVLMSPESSLDLDLAVFNSNINMVIKNPYPFCNGLLDNLNPYVDLGKLGLASFTNSPNLEFHNLNMSITTGILETGTIRFYNCHAETGFNDGLLLGGADLEFYHSRITVNPVWGAWGITVSDSASNLRIKQSWIEGQISLNAAATIYGDFSYFGSSIKALLADTGANLRFEHCHFLTTSANDVAVYLVGNPVGFGFMGCTFHATVSALEALSVGAAWSNAPVYGCISRNGFDSDITFETGNNSNLES